MKKSPFIIVFLLLSSACTVGPKYSRPSAPVPGAYKEIGSEASQDLKGWKVAQPGDQGIKGKWWEIFGDPGLNVLEESVSVSNQDIKAVEAAFREARARVRLSRADYYPSFVAGASITDSRLSSNRPLHPTPPGGSYGDFILPADLSYELDVWGRVHRSVEAAKAGAQASAADLESVKLSIQAELAADYFQLHGLDDESQLLQQTVIAYKKALQLTTNRYKGGAASRVEVDQAESQLEVTRAQAIDITVQRAQIEHAIAVLAGQPVSGFSLPVVAIAVPPAKIPVGLPSELLERRPDVAAAERRVAAANAEIGIAKAAFFPKLTLNAFMGMEGSGITNWLSWPSRFWGVGPALAQTLFDGGRRRAMSEQAQAAYDAAVASYRETVLTAVQEVEDNLAALRILEQESYAQNDGVLAAERSLNQSTIRYKGGLVTYLEVVTAQSAALAAERSAVDILRRRMVASVLLVKALGGGWNASSLSMDVSLHP